MIEVLSVVVGSLIAFVGVLISNKNNDKRLQTQLKHDAELKIIERKASMRREVYLNAAEELVKANSYLGSLAQMDIEKTNITEGLQGFFIAATRLGLVAEEETGKASNDVVLAYSGLLFRLLRKITPISDRRIKIDIINEKYEESRLEIKRILATIRSQNESEEPNQTVLSSLNQAFKQQMKRAKELTDERDEYWMELNILTNNFALDLAHEMKCMAQLQIPMMIGIRKELDIETDIDSYRRQVTNNTEKLTKQLDEFIAAIEKRA